MESTLGYEDGLYLPEVGKWAEEKYRIVSYYDDIFSTGMKNKWESRIYIDLFAGAGYAKVRGASQVVQTSALLALGVRDPFTKYIFCEEKVECLQALRSRVDRHYPEANVEFVPGDSNLEISSVIEGINRSKTTKSPLTFCFADPFNLGIKFKTIRALERGLQFVDLLVLLALEVDARRNQTLYEQVSNTTIDDFLDDRDWRTKWKAVEREGWKFDRFIAERFKDNMFSLGYLPAPESQMIVIRAGDRGPLLYHLAFFSKHERGYDFWSKILKYSREQTQLDLGM